MVRLCEEVSIDQYLARTISDVPYAIIVDESSDRGGRPVVCFLLSTWDRFVLADLQFVGEIGLNGLMLATMATKTIEKFNLRKDDCVGWITEEICEQVDSFSKAIIPLVDSLAFLMA